MMLKKLRSECGETLVETVVSMLLVMLIVAFLTMAIVTSSRINVKIKNEDYAFQADADTLTGLTVKINGVTQATNLHQSDNGYYYYD